MAESKAELTDRWRREGREEEVARFRRQVREDCRAQGVSKKEAHETAWSEAARNFPPLPPPKPPSPASGVRLIDGKTPAQRVAEWNAEWAVAEVVEVGQPPADLPEDTGVDEDLDWAWRNFLVIVSRVIERHRMFWEIDWSRAVTPVPSDFAVEEIRRKMTEPNAFEVEFRMRAPIRWWPDDDDDA
jgi:hypothetical protein